MHAQPSSYQPVLDDAIREFSVGNYTESLALFRQAQQLWPNARALRAIGRCQYELGDYAAAETSLQDALGARERALDAGQRAETEHLLERVREHIARLFIVTDPPAASVRIDGVIATPDANGKYALAPGVHSIEAGATGFLPAHREITASAQREERVELRLLPLVAEETVPIVSEPPTRDDTHDDRPLRKKWWLWTSVAGAVAVAAVATVLVVNRDDPKPERASGGTSGIAIGVPAASR